MLTPKENLLKLYNHEIPERIPNAWEDMFRWMPKEILERGPAREGESELGGTGYDWFGVHWTYTPQTNAATPSPGYDPILTDITKWREQVKFPDLDAIDWEAAWERDRKNPGYSPDKMACATFLNGPFERLHALMGFEEALVSIMLEPESCREFFEEVVTFKIKLLDKMTAYYPVDILEQHDDYGHQQNAFMSVEQWEELLAPPMKRLVDHCREKGIIFQLHSCGKVESLIPSFIKIGIEHWSSCQPMNDLEGILHKYGDRLTLWAGGSAFLKYDKDNLDDDKRRAILEDQIFKFCKGGAFIPGVRNPDFAEMFSKMMEEKRDYYKNPENCKLP